MILTLRNQQQSDTGSPVRCKSVVVCGDYFRLLLIP